MVSETQQPIARDGNIKISSHIPTRTITSFLVITFFVYSFISGLTYKFYASFLFLFYAWIGRMWIAVVFLGLFQVLLMIPFRIINLKLSNHINEFKEKTKELKSEKDQSFYIQHNIRRGNRPLLFYTIDFVVQLTSYLTIGRLFLTNFYTIHLSPDRLFSFVPYPEYPIQSTFFKIPYLRFVKTKDFGIGLVFIIWLLIVLFKFSVHAYRYYKKRQKTQKNKSQSLSLPVPKIIQRNRKYLRYISGNSIFIFVVTWLILRNFPTKVQFGIFSGDISIPNRTFNTITAIVTFATIFWFGSSKIRRKTKLAQAQNMDREIIFKTQKDMFKQTLRSATLVGLGAFFITNHIPSAFELSIFTFELVAILSPFTLDKIILSSQVG